MVKALVMFLVQQAAANKSSTVNDVGQVGLAGGLCTKLQLNAIKPKQCTRACTDCWGPMKCHAPVQV